MPATLDKPPCLHREETPVRTCRACGAYLTTGNDDPYCFQHGGWSTSRLRSLGELGPSAPKVERAAALFGELMSA